MRITLIQHPTVALKMSGFTPPDFSEFADAPVCLGQVYRRVMPVSLARVASLIEKHLDAEVGILDLRIMAPEREEVTKTVDWEGYEVTVSRVGASFTAADDAIRASDWIGFSSHFTFESGVIRDLIAHARALNPDIRIMVGGADVAARPQDYVNFGANLVFTGDFDPDALCEAVAAPDSGWLAARVVPPYRHPFSELIRPAFGLLAQLNDYRDSHDGEVPEGVTFPIGFIYFTRGCPRECDFCESRQTKFEALDLESAIAQLQHYAAAGIHTLNLTDDNLLIMAAKKGWREDLLTLLATMRELKFAWEFPNGLEIGRLLQRDGTLDEDVMRALFSHEIDATTGRIVGAYRLYVPVETFDRREGYRKLKPAQDQKRILTWLAQAGLPEMDFGVVIPPNATAETFQNTEEGYRELRAIMRLGATRCRYSVFHLIPIALYRGIDTKHSVYSFPEAWTFHFPVYDGDTLTAGELFESRLRLLKRLDYGNYLSMAKGAYSYSTELDDEGPTPAPVPLKQRYWDLVPVPASN